MFNFKTVFVVVISALTASVITVILVRGDVSPLESASDPDPLYWVAPMDSQYRRDKPGLSPMGMDLIPVYPERGAAVALPVGAVRISAAVENNLGVRTQRVELRVLESHIDTVGYVRQDENKLAQIHPRVEGWIEQLHVKSEGDRVERGQLLYSLYSLELVNLQKEFVLALSRNDSDVIASTEIRLLSFNVSAQFIEQLRLTRGIQKAIPFYSRQSGFIKNLSVREGFYVKPGITLMTIGEQDEVWVEADVFASQAARVRAGQRIIMTTEYYPARQWQAQVSYVYPNVNPINRTIRVRLQLENKGFLLKPEMYTKVRIFTGTPLKKIVVPRPAVIRTGAQNRVVLALGQGRYKSIEVTLGGADKHGLEVLDGLKVGDRVVTSAQFLLDSESSKSSDFVRMESSMAPDLESSNSVSEPADVAMAEVIVRD